VLAKRLCEAMGGSIGVESELGLGSTFHCRVAFEESTPQRESRPVSRREPFDVLVAMANESGRRAVCEMVEALGGTCSDAASGNDARTILLERAREARPIHVALIDASLSDMEGRTFVDLFAENLALAAVPVVTLSYPGQTFGASAALIRARLSKPVRSSQLEACLLMVLCSPHLLGAPHSSASSPPACGAAPLPVPAQTTTEEPRPRLLIVEDNTVNQRVAQVMVEKRGYAADVVASGALALEAMARHHYEAVLMDCQMPKLDGYATTAQIRAREAEGQRTPIIAMTANVGPLAREKCLAAGMDDYISKPVLGQELDRVLARWAPRKEERTLAERPSDPGKTRPARVIDLRMLEELGANDPKGLVREVIELFLLDAPERVAALHDAMARGDMSALACTAHTLKGSAGHLGARALATLCARLEALGRADARESAALALAAVEDELERVREALVAETLRGNGEA